MTIDTEPDLSAFVINLLDEHLAAMLLVRERLRPGGRISPGARRTVALDSITVAERYATELSRALNDD
ncbi:hypothetical protein [Paractinoplanes toevensis]|nr:hypothetical protein [Actinoplanes toevensis]